MDAIVSAVPALLEGARVTMVLAVASLAVATVVGIVVAIARTTQNRLIAGAAKSYVIAVRHTPELVQLYLIYYSLPAWGLVVPAFVAATIVFGLHFGAYLSEVFRGGIASIERSQWEAARILGIGKGNTWRHVILPQVVRRVLPSWGNYVLIIIKGTSLAAVITVPEMLYRANVIATGNFRFFEIFTLLALIYLGINLIGSELVRGLERRLARFG